jgi:hypothetical protein
VPATTDIAELAPVERAQCYRRLGEDAVRQAQTAGDSEMRSAYEFLAEHWLQLAHATEQAARMKAVMLPAWELPTQNPLGEEP